MDGGELLTNVLWGAALAGEDLEGSLGGSGPELSSVLALGLGIKVWVDVALGEDVLVCLGGEDGDLVDLVVFEGVADGWKWRPEADGWPES